MYRLLAIFVLLAACSKPNPSSTLVYKSAGAEQCNHHGISINDSARMLNNAGIEVLLSYCAVNTDFIVATVCGGPTADIRVHSIPTSALSKAVSIGYRATSNLATEAGPGYRKVDCP